VFVEELGKQMDRASDGDRRLTKDALIKRATDCRSFFEHCLTQKANWDWALKGVWYSKLFCKTLERSPINITRCLRIGRMAQRRFRCSHPNILSTLGRDVVLWVEQNYCGTVASP
jgi:hypothetical protein